MVFNTAKKYYNVFERKRKTFREDPLLGILRIPKLCKRYVNMANPIFQRCAEYQLRQRGYLDFLKHRPPDAILPDFCDLWFLYKTVRHRNPRFILEFGSGCSTIVLTQALWDNRRESSKNSGYLYSIEEDPYWTEVTAKSMPEYLEGLCEIWYSSLLEVDYKGIPAFRYAKIPNITPELIYLDGPTLTPERQVAVDVLDIEERFQPGFCIVVDGRIQNTMFLRKYLKRQYIFKHRRLFFNSVFKLIK